MKTIEKDILTVEKGIIVHQTNCQGVMGTGMALAIKQKWPHVFQEYKEFCSQFSLKSNALGCVQLVKANDNIYVCNLFGQDRYGRDKRYTSYGAWEKALPELKDLINAKALALYPIYFPYNVGCMNAGGDFRIVSAMIEEHFPEAIFCKLQKKWNER